MANLELPYYRNNKGLHYHILRFNSVHQHNSNKYVFWLDKSLSYSHRNLLAVGIAYRIIAQSFNYGKSRSSKMRNLVPIAIIIVKSGAIYASSVLVLLITYLAGTNGQYPVLDVITPLVVRCDFTVRNGQSSPNEL